MFLALVLIPLACLAVLACCALVAAACRRSERWTRPRAPVVMTTVY